jgi:GNAT superfamily N-acetyltransferase
MTPPSATRFRALLEKRSDADTSPFEWGGERGIRGLQEVGGLHTDLCLADARFRGVSRALLAALERRAAERGNSQCTLASTATARRFDRANGYLESGPARGDFGTRSGFPMHKALK